MEQEQNNSHNLQYSKILWIFIIIFLLILLPYVILSLFSHPASDDFCFAQNTISKGIFGALLDWYNNWTGRYFSTLLNSLSPMALGFYGGQKLVGIAGVLGICFSLFYFFHTLFKNKLLFEEKLLISLSIASVYILTIPSLIEGFYWMAGSTTYIWGNIFFIIFIALIYKVFTQKVNTKIYLLIIILIIFIIGSNEAIMVITDLVIFFALILQFIRKSTTKWIFLLFFIIASIFSCIVYFAPGNEIRSLNVISENKNSITFALNNSLSFTSDFYSKTPNLLLLGISFIFIGMLISNKSTIKKNISILSIIASFIFGILSVFIVSFLIYWSTGLPITTRSVSIVSMLFLFSWFSTLYFLTLWILNVIQLKIATNTNVIKFVLILIGTLIIFYTLINNPKSYNFNNALFDLYSGDAYKFDQQLLQRREYIKLNKQQAEIEVPQLKTLPISISFTDLSSNANEYQNVCESHYFGINSLKGTVNPL